MTLPLSRPVYLFLLINNLIRIMTLLLVEILFCKTRGPGPLSLPTGLVAGSGALTAWTQPLSGWEPKPGSKLLQAKAT